MPENIGNIYSAQIPSITDDADIQTAFRLYHYGSNTGNPSSIPANSLAGHLTNLENTKIDILPTPIPNSVNLNNITDTGFYTQTSVPSAPNYPSNFPGLLTVVNSGSLKTEPDGDENNFNNKQQLGVVFQQYQVIGAAESGNTPNPLNKTHWRFYFAGAWRPWRTYIDEADFSTKGDPRYVQTSGSATFISNYYTKAEITGFLAPIYSTYLTIEQADTRSLITENVQTETYTLRLSDKNKVVAMNNASPAIVYVPTHESHESMGEDPFPIGSIVNVYAMSNQTITIKGKDGVVVQNSGRLFERYVEVSLRKRANNEWVASGNIVPV